MNLTLEPVLRQLSGRNQLFLAFDRDGTLVPYADHPDKAVMDQDLKNVLAGLAGLPEVDVAIVSARSIKALERDFDSADKINLAGNYGLEIRLGDGGDFMEPSVVEALPELKEIMRALQPLTAEATGGILEDHGLSLCLHWHKVDESRMSLVREVVESIKQSLSCVRFHSYPTSFEFIADVDWTKADGLSVLEERLRLKEKDSFYLFVGDTDSDEPGFEWVQARGGISIRVGNLEVPSVANYRAERPVQVGELLSQLLELRLNAG